MASGRSFDVGLLTKTVIPGSVVHQILPLCLRGHSTTHLVFVGEDSIQLHEILDDAHLHRVFVKCDFGCCIRSSCMLGDYQDTQSEDYIKHEDGHKSHVDPSSILLLVLETAEIVVVEISEHNVGISGIAARTLSRLPLPASPDPLSFIGHFLTADPKSRAIAVAARDGTLMLFSAKPPTFSPPTAEQKLLRLAGTVQQMAFLYPPGNDTDQIILLAVLISDRKVFLQRIEWLHSENLANVTLHTPQRISTEGRLPTLLIPLLGSADFLIANADTITLHAQLLSGHVQQHYVNLDQLDPVDSGNQHAWATWTRSFQGHDPSAESLYVVREDGLLFELKRQAQVSNDKMTCRKIGDLGCAVDNAFVSFNDSQGFDCVVISGNMSAGSVQRIIGSDEDTGELCSLEVVETLPDWTPTLDVISSSLQHSHEKTPRMNSGLFASSGRQSYGRIEELRYGVQARLAGLFPAEDLQSSTHIWALPSASTQEVLLLLTNPLNSRLVSFSTGEGSDLVVAILDESSDHGFDLTSRTLAAVAISSSRTIQVSEAKILLIEDGKRIYEEPTCMPEFDKSLAADISQESSLGLVALRKQDGCDGCVLKLFYFGGPELIKLESMTECRGKVTCVRTFGSIDYAYVAIGTSNGCAHIYKVDQEMGLILERSHELSPDNDHEVVCESIAVLESIDQQLVLLCGLRDGSVVAILTGDDSVAVRSRRYNLGLASVRLVSCNAQGGRSLRNEAPVNCTNRILATCGSRIVVFGWRGPLSFPSIDNIYVTDLGESSYLQPAISALVQIPMLPHTDNTGLAGSFIMIGGDEGLIVQLDEESQMVPRSINLDGGPNRLMYSSRLSCFVVASIHTTWSSKPSAPAKSTRVKVSRALIEFRPAGGHDWTYTFKMQTGERVYGLMEWTYRNLAEGKDYFFILAASGINDDRGRTKGRVHLLQPIVKDRQVVDVRLATTTKFDSPVYAIAPYGELSYVACNGCWLVIYQFSPSDRKWLQVGRYKLSSPAVHITATPPYIQVTTGADSFLVFQVSEQTKPSDGRQNEPESVNTLLLLKPIGMDTKQGVGQYHVNIKIKESSMRRELAIMSTKYGEIRGLDLTQARSPTHSTSLPTVFEAKIRRSLTRILQADLCSPWKAQRHGHVIADDLIGTSVDGTVTGLVLIALPLWHELRYIQVLCERSSEICPFRRHRDVTDHRGILIALARFRMEESAENLGLANESRPSDAIDGDILQRLLDRGGAELLERLLRRESETQDSIGEYVSKNLDRELSRVESTIAILETVLDRWF